MFITSNGVRLSLSQF